MVIGLPSESVCLCLCIVFVMLIKEIWWSAWLVFLPSEWSLKGLWVSQQAGFKYQKQHLVVKFYFWCLDQHKQNTKLGLVAEVWRRSKSLKVHHTVTELKVAPSCVFCLISSSKFSWFTSIQIKEKQKIFEYMELKPEHFGILLGKWHIN